MTTNLSEQPHRRRNALTGEWVLVSPHRTRRPWKGEVAKPAAENRPAYDPGCYLCPGNERAGGIRNPDYHETFVFPNDFAAILPDTTGALPDADPLMSVAAVRGTCRVICFSPRHDLTMAEMEAEAIAPVVDLWAAQVSELGQDYAWVQVFENKGAMMGCSNPHPHGQIWASGSLPDEPAREDERQRRYLNAHGQPLLMDYLSRELDLGERIVVENEHWAVLVPFWAVWPFETLLLPKRRVERLPDLTAEARQALADILRRHLTRYDNLFETEFPYTMGWHGAPAGVDGGHWQLHAHFYPPLLRSASVKKFMVGYEMLAEAQRDITPEAAAGRLRELSEIHYKRRR